MSEDLECKGCRNQYIVQNNGVFNLVSQKLSSFDNATCATHSTSQIPYAGTTEPLTQEEQMEEFLRDITKTRVEPSEEYEQAWQQVRQKMNDFINPLLNELSGTVCDLATGLGSHLDRLLNAETKDFNIVCIDIEKSALGFAAQKNNPRIFCVAGDAHYMPIKDNSFDYITSHGVFCEVAESDKVAKEMYRTLKQGGKLIIRGEYIDKEDSESFELAKSMKLEKGVIEESLIRELENAGFKNIVSTVVAEIKKEIQQGILPPVVGGMQYFYVIQAEKC